MPADGFKAAWGRIFKLYPGFPIAEWPRAAIVFAVLPLARRVRKARSVRDQKRCAVSGLTVVQAKPDGLVCPIRSYGPVLATC